MADRLLTKLVITHRRALLQKYQRRGYKEIKSALEEMRAADLERGIVLRLAHLDGPMAGYTAVTDPLNQRQCKRAVDALYAKFERPDYVLLLGGPDVVPFQDLTNPCARFGDADSRVPSDLPYACDQTYGTRIEEFRTPCRVVGRLPDVPGATDVSELLDLIRRACAAPPLGNRKCFALSSRSRKSVAEEALRNSFSGAPPVVWSAPPYGPEFGKSWLKRAFHFINCHGRPGHPEFFASSDGQSDVMQVAMTPASIKGRLGDAAIVAATAAYGAQLYTTRSHRSMGGMGMAYLQEGATAYVGSSTSTYGGASASDVSCADIFCADFLAQVLAGASTGRALLETRQRFIAQADMLDPFQLKTLAQFVLYGDPSYRGHSGGLAIDPSTRIGDHHRRRRQLTAIGKSLEYRALIPARSEEDDRGHELSANGSMQDEASGNGLHVMPMTPGTARPRPSATRRRSATAKTCHATELRLRHGSSRHQDSSSASSGMAEAKPDERTGKAEVSGARCEASVTIASARNGMGELVTVVTRRIAGRTVSISTLTSC